MNKEWLELLQTEMQKEYYINLQKSIVQKRKDKTVFPPGELTFSAFNISPKDVRVVILGQDPYHGVGQAHGLSFSVLPGTKLPPSLKNIYKEITSEYGYAMPKENGYLLPWAEQGVFLLNSVLTVEESSPGSHQKMGWETFTNSVVSKISETQKNVVFMLWGAYSRSKVNLIDESKHLVLESPHPSPFSARHGFFGNNHFIKANQYLRENGFSEIDWSV